MERALVLGASGGMGYSIVNELSRRGVKVTALARTKNKLEKLFAQDENVTIFAGDIFNLQDLKAAATDVDVIFQAANIPYVQWEERLLPFMKNIVATAKDNDAKLAIVENIYSYGRSPGNKVDELTVKNPHTKKGKIRLKVEEFVMQSDVEALIAHFPDFYGPNAENTIIHYTLQSIVENKKASYVGNQKIAREFIFTPDGAKAIVNLAENAEAFGHNWNIPGYGVISGEEIVGLLREKTGYTKGVSTISKNMIRFIGLFNKNMREVVEMFYLNDQPVILCGDKYEQKFGPLPKSTYKQGLDETIEFMRKNVQGYHNNSQTK